MSRLILTESEISRIRSLYNLNEESNKATFLNWNGRSPGQFIFDYLRKHEGDAKGNHIPYVYDDRAAKVYNKDKKMKMPPKYTGGEVYGTLTIGWGTTDPSVIDKYMNKEMSVSEAKEYSAKNIQEAANCIKRWQNSALDTDHNDRKLTASMYIAMADIAYNLGCSGFRNEDGISKIEKGKFKSAQSWIKDGLNWGHPRRRKETGNLFCRDGGCVDN